MSPSVCQRKEVMTSSQSRAETHQTTKLSLQGKLTSPRILGGDNYLLRLSYTWLMGTLCPETRTTPGRGCKALEEATKGPYTQASLA